MSIPAKPAPARDTEDLALRSVILYKLIKGSAELTLALVCILVVVTGHAESLHTLAEVLRHHVSRAWAVRAAIGLSGMATRHHVELTALALFLDGVLTAVESWALHTRRWWAEWLVVIASGALLPYEVLEIVRHVRVGRVLVFLVNLVIVVYMARRAHRRGRGAPKSA